MVEGIGGVGDLMKAGEVLSQSLIAMAASQVLSDIADCLQSQSASEILIQSRRLWNSAPTASGSTAAKQVLFRKEAG